MEQKRDKLWRRQQCFRVFNARMRLFAAMKSPAFDQNGKEVQNPSWELLSKQRWCRVYKTTGTPCSCYICRHERYDRLDYRNTTRRLVRESL